MAIAVLAIAAFTLGVESGITFLRGDPPELLALLEVRGPMTLVGSGLLVGIFVIRRRFAADPPPDSLEVMTGTGYVTIATAEIECLEADGNYLNVAHVSGRTYLLRSTMQAAERALGQRFVRIHRSMIVNRARIRERRRGGQLVLQSGRVVRIGRAFRSRLA
jgi:DNA-binding LytR/AlgR family response regulator